jgi:O-acetyl-ADP-ribose deacetylase (regulator of RNase III)
MGMLSFVRGDLFDSPATVLVNTVNTVGVMGKGIALTFKQLYPDMFRRYQSVCESGTLDVGKLWLFKSENKWILNFPTKKHWRNPSKLEYVEAGLSKFAAIYSEQRITSIAFPQLGCGNGELAWEQVRPLMVKYLQPLPINIYVYLYDRDSTIAVEHREIERMRLWLQANPAELPFAEFWSDLKEVVGAGLKLEAATSGSPFVARMVSYEEEGLLLQVGVNSWLQELRDSVRNTVNEATRRWRFMSKRMIYIPESSLRDLWQSIRFYGFFLRRTSPGGLDVLYDQLLAILCRLQYLRPVNVAVSRPDDASSLEQALQLSAYGAQKPKVETSVELIAA